MTLTWRAIPVPAMKGNSDLFFEGRKIPPRHLVKSDQFPVGVVDDLDLRRFFGETYRGPSSKGSRYTLWDGISPTMIVASHCFPLVRLPHGSPRPPRQGRERLPR
jgi:hypothetical protein